MRQIQVGEMVLSPQFGSWVKVIRIDSDSDWYFMASDRRVYKAELKLSYVATLETFTEGR